MITKKYNFSNVLVEKVLGTNLKIKIKIYACELSPINNPIEPSEADILKLSLSC